MKPLKHILPSPLLRDECYVLYGSCARGDVRSDSDIDLLRISEKRARLRQLSRNVSLHTYSRGDLLQMASDGNLFLYHILTEGRFLAGDRRILDELSACYRRPSSFETSAVKSVTSASPIVDADEIAFATHPRVFMDVAIYLCRSLLYARHADRGPMTFSLEELSRRDEDAERLFNIKSKEAKYADFLSVANAIASRIGLPYVRPTYSNLSSLSSRQNSPLLNSFLRRLATGSRSIYG